MVKSTGKRFNLAHQNSTLRLHIYSCRLDTGSPPTWTGLIAPKPYPPGHWWPTHLDTGGPPTWKGPDSPQTLSTCQTSKPHQPGLGHPAPKPYPPGHWLPDRQTPWTGPPSPQTPTHLDTGCQTGKPHPPEQPGKASQPSNPIRVPPTSTLVPQIDKPQTAPT